MLTKFIHDPLLKKPSAWLPLALSAAAFTLIWSYIAIFGITAPAAEQDEGAAARIFQLLMVAQLPIMVYFGLRWLPQQPKQTLLVLALQAAVWLVPILTIIWLES